MNLCLVKALCNQNILGVIDAHLSLLVIREILILPVEKKMTMSFFFFKSTGLAFNHPFNRKGITFALSFKTLRKI